MSLLMENNNDSESTIIPDNSGLPTDAASGLTTNSEPITVNNVSQNLGGTINPAPTPMPQQTFNPSATDVPVSQSLGTAPTPVPQQPFTPSTTDAPVNMDTSKNTTDPSTNSTLPTNGKKRPKMVKIFTVAVSIILFGAAIGGSYMFGRSHEKVVVKEASTTTTTPQPINLPPQAVVLNECVVGRGKQYILPQDIPVGPIYDVVNSRVIAIEYSLDLVRLLDGSDIFSDTILKLVNDYPTNHLSIVPDNPDLTKLKRVQLIMFTVQKEEANKIKCDGNTTITS